MNNRDRDQPGDRLTDRQSSAGRKHIRMNPGSIPRTPQLRDMYPCAVGSLVVPGMCSLVIPSVRVSNDHLYLLSLFQFHMGPKRAAGPDDLGSKIPFPSLRRELLLFVFPCSEVKSDHIQARGERGCS